MFYEAAYIDDSILDDIQKTVNTNNSFLRLSNDELLLMKYTLSEIVLPDHILYFGSTKTLIFLQSYFLKKHFKASSFKRNFSATYCCLEILI